MASNPIIPLSILWDVTTTYGNPPQDAQLALEIVTRPDVRRAAALSRAPLALLGALLLLLGVGALRWIPRLRRRSAA